MTVSYFYKNDKIRKKYLIFYVIKYILVEILSRLDKMLQLLWGIKMKKLLIVALAAAVSACACFECDEEVPVTTYRTVQAAQPNCDYFDGRTCYRYVYRRVHRPVAQPVRYREPRPCPVCQPAPVVCAQPACNNGCNGCETTIRETREPVEVVYKKTTYKTVYEPKTYSQVSYEKAPYHDVAAQPETIEVVDDNQVLLNDVK